MTSVILSSRGILRKVTGINKMSTAVGNILELSVQAAERSGEVIRKIMKEGRLGIVEKTGANDLQTLADRTVSDILLMSLRRSFPKINVISEEGDTYFDEEAAEKYAVTHSDIVKKYETPDAFKNVRMEDITVWVDPLDGTKEYTDGFVERVTVLIGIAVKTASVAGVIHQPYFKCGESEIGRSIYGIVGGPIERTFEQSTKPLNGKVVVTTRSHSTALVDEVIQELGASEVIRVGGAGYKVLMLIDGLAHYYVFPTPGCKKWDTCAPEAVLKALGGKLTDINGNSYDYDASVNHINEWGVIASADATQHQGIINMIPENLKAKVKSLVKSK